MRRREESFTWGRLLWRLGRRPPRALVESPRAADRGQARDHLRLQPALRLLLHRLAPPHAAAHAGAERRGVARGRAPVARARHRRGGRHRRRAVPAQGADPRPDRDAGRGRGRRDARTPTAGSSTRRSPGRLGALRGVTAHVSLDGARAGLHDGSRGVPGSWRRAVEGIDRLLGSRGAASASCTW